MRKRDKKAVVKILQQSEDMQKKYDRHGVQDTPMTKYSGTPTSIKSFSD